MIITAAYILATAISGWQFNFLYGIIAFGMDILLIPDIKINVNNTGDKYTSLLIYDIEQKLKAIEEKLRGK